MCCECPSPPDKAVGKVHAYDMRDITRFLDIQENKKTFCNVFAILGRLFSSCSIFILFRSCFLLSVYRWYDCFYVRHSIGNVYHRDYAIFIHSSVSCIDLRITTTMGCSAVDIFLPILHLTLRVVPDWTSRRQIGIVLPFTVPSILPTLSLVTMLTHLMLFLPNIKWMM